MLDLLLVFTLGVLLGGVFGWCTTRAGADVAVPGGGER